MAVVGVALLAISFLPWPAVGQQAAPQRSDASGDELAAEGAALFRAKGCVSCHRHAAVDPEAAGIGPDLTGYNPDPAFLRRWLQNPQALRPDTRMPDLQLEAAEIEALIAFLEKESDESARGVPATDSFVSLAPAAEPTLRPAAAKSMTGNEGISSELYPAVAELLDLSRQARELAWSEIPAPILRQVYTDLHSTGFFFTDSAATVEVDVVVPAPSAPPEDWDVHVLSEGKLTGHRGEVLRLHELQIGPRDVAQAMLAQWPGCTIRALTLISEDNGLRWVGFCDTPAGTVSGYMDGDAGIWHPSAAPPARPPLIATPSGQHQTAGDPVLPGTPPATCPVTREPEHPFSPPPPYPASAPYDGHFWYGTESLWTMLPVGGRWDQLARGEKVWWWRLGYSGRQEPQPELGITARRLDGKAPVAESAPPATNGYHADFHWAILTGFQVPTAGCWEITGHYQDQVLSFIVWVAP